MASNLLNVTFRNVPNVRYQNTRTYYNVIPENTSEYVYYVVYTKHDDKYYFWDSTNNIQLTDTTDIRYKMLREYANMILDNMRTTWKAAVKSANEYVIKVMVRNLPIAGSKPGQSLHRNMAVFSNNVVLPQFNGYKSFVQTLFFPKTGVDIYRREIPNNKLPRTYYIPKYSITPSGRYVKTAFKSNNLHLHTPRNNTDDYKAQEAKSVRGKAGKIMQFLSPIGYHSAEKTNMPHTRSIVLSHLYIPPTLYANFFNSLGIPLSKKANIVGGNPTYYVKRTHKSALANLIRAYPVNRINTTNITVKNMNKLKNYGINLKNNNTFINIARNGRSYLIPENAKAILKRLKNSRALPSMNNSTNTNNLIHSLINRNRKIVSAVSEYYLSNSEQNKKMVQNAYTNFKRIRNRNGKSTLAFKNFMNRINKLSKE
jgi:hypothetical protein